MSRLASRPSGIASATPVGPGLRSVPVGAPRGIGRRLIREQMRVHANRGVTDALLQVCLPDPAAARFHEAMGFSEIETGSTYRKDGL